MQVNLREALRLFLIMKAKCCKTILPYHTGYVLLMCCV